MERIAMIERAATALWARLRPERATDYFGADFLGSLCVALSVEVKPTPASDVMLGGAYSRLQLWDCAVPDMGGFIWLRDDLDAATRAFAIAHELGHYTLHRGEGINVRPPCDERQIDQQADPAGLRAAEHRVAEYTPRAQRELEANAFAAELLAPRAVVRRDFAINRTVDAPALAQRRLVDAVLAPARLAPLDRVELGAHPATNAAPPTTEDLVGRLDILQRGAARTSGPALVVAGPGTGKTATLVGRVAYLVAERGIPPEKVLALTFSNRAAGEMRERLARSGLPGERMPIMTIHACAAALLREYASGVPHAPNEAELQPDFRILDEADAFLLLEDLLARLPLHYYRSLGNPTRYLRELLADFARARDGLHTPAAYRTLVAAMPLMPLTQRESAKTTPGTAQPPAGMFTTEQIARARERAEAYAIWDRELRQRGLLDFGGLIQRVVEMLRANADVLAYVRARFPHMLVDEFQDTNRAAAEMLLLLAGPAGTGLWVVGDRNQSIYRFRGASPSNVRRLVETYPDLHVLTLRHCYRSVPSIVRLGSAMAARMAALAPEPAAGTGVQSDTLHVAQRPLELQPVRADAGHPAIQRGETFISAMHERVGLAAAIQRQRVAGYAYADQAVLCRTHKQVRQIAAILAARGVPVTQLSDFFERPEIKDALMLAAIAAGPDARGLLRAAPLLVWLGHLSPATGELARVARALASRHQRLPWALRGGDTLAQIADVSTTTRAGLAALGAVAVGMRNGATVGQPLAEFLLRPGGYAWHLVRTADGLDAPQSATATEDSTALLPGLERPAAARQALAALGELVRLAWSFDTRWAREPEFRSRLSRAVTHRHVGTPAPDALEAVAGADLLPDPGANASGTASDAPLDVAPTAPAVRCFLHYLSALRSADVAVSVPAGEDDAVHLLTLHQSKGLEFPVVYLPGLAHGEFPRSVNTHDEASPPGFREGDTPDERAAEERCLFYVGVTRARDVVAITRATSYHTSATGAASSARPSPLLDLLAESPEWAHATPPLLDSELTELRVPPAEDNEDGGDLAGDDVAENERVSELASGPHDNSASKPIFRLRDLEQYLDCPRQYKYARGYGLLDPAEDAVYRFHRYIRRGRRALGELREGTPAAQWPAAEAQLKALWQTDGPAGHAYDAFYWQAAEAILRDEWQALTAPERETAARRVLLAQPLRAELRHCIVEVTADRVLEALPATDEHAAATAPVTMFVRLHTGRPRQEDKQDLALPLYYLAHQSQHPGAPLRILLGYVGQGLARKAPPPHDPQPSASADASEDMTERARHDAERYLTPGRRQRSKLDKLDEAALAIAAARFAPRPEERRCAACAYCYVCPADPDDADRSVFTVPTTTVATNTTGA